MAASSVHMRVAETFDRVFFARTLFWTLPSAGYSFKSVLLKETLANTMSAAWSLHITPPGAQHPRTALRVKTALSTPVALRLARSAAIVARSARMVRRAVHVWRMSTYVRAMLHARSVDTLDKCGFMVVPSAQRNDQYYRVFGSRRQQEPVYDVMVPVHHRAVAATVLGLIEMLTGDLARSSLTHYSHAHYRISIEQTISGIFSRVLVLNHWARAGSFNYETHFSAGPDALVQSLHGLVRDLQNAAQKHELVSRLGLVAYAKTIVKEAHHAVDIVAPTIERTVTELNYPSWCLSSIVDNIISDVQSNWPPIRGPTNGDSRQPRNVVTTQMCAIVHRNTRDYVSGSDNALPPAAVISHLKNVGNDLHEMPSTINSPSHFRPAIFSLNTIMHGTPLHYVIFTMCHTIIDGIIDAMDADVAIAEDFPFEEISQCVESHRIWTVPTPRPYDMYDDSDEALVSFMRALISYDEDNNNRCNAAATVEPLLAREWLRTLAKMRYLIMYLRSTRWLGGEYADGFIPPHVACENPDFAVGDFITDLCDIVLKNRVQWGI